MTKYVPELVVFSKAAKLSSDSVKKSTNLDTPPDTPTSGPPSNRW